MTAAQTHACFVIPSLAPGGTERQLLYLIRGLASSHKCTVICTRQGGAWSDTARDYGATVHELNTWGGWDFRIAQRVRSLMQAEQPQILQTFLSGFDLPVNRVARECGVPVIVSSRRELATWMKPRHLRAQRRANELVDCIVANSRAVAAYSSAAEGVDMAAIRVIHNGIEPFDVSPAVCADLRKRLGVPSEKKVIAMLANFSPVKDHALFLAVAGLVLQNRADVQFLLVGDGPLRKQIVRAIHQNGWQDRFCVTSSIDDAPRLLALADICMLTSKQEGFPNAVMEAMAAARPVVASAVGGIPELVEDTITGILVPTREPSDYVAAVNRLLDSPDQSMAMGQRARQRVQVEFGINRMVRAYTELYADLLQRKSVGASG